MTLILFLANFLLAAAMLISGLTRRAGYLELPFLTGAIYFLWYLPQASALLVEPSLPHGGLARVLGMSLLCIVAVWLGWARGAKGVRAPALVQMSPRHLVWPVGALTAFAFAMRLLIMAQPAEVRALGQWTGPITILSFLASTAVVSLVLSLALFLRQRTLVTIGLAIANLALYAPTVFIYFRRADTFELFFAILLAAYFFRRQVVPRSVIAIALTLGLFFVNGVGQLRSLGGGYTLNNAGEIETRLPTLDEIAQIDWLSVLPKEGSPSYEVRNAVMYMDAIYGRSEFTLGAEIYNRFILNYIPGQLIGFENKRRLMIGVSLEELAQRETSHQTHVGTTSTGFAHPYRDFWYLGAAVFALMAYWMGRLFKSACSGDLWAYAAYAATLGLSVHAVTHYGYYYPLNAILPLASLSLVLHFAGPQRTPASLRQQSIYATHK